MKNATDHEIEALHRVTVQAVISRGLPYIHIPEVRAVLDDIENNQLRLENMLSIIRDEETYEELNREARVLRFR